MIVLGCVLMGLCFICVLASVIEFEDREVVKSSVWFLLSLLLGLLSISF